MASNESARQRCAARHMGAWLIEPNWFADAFRAVDSGAWQPGPGFGDSTSDERSETDKPGFPVATCYEVDGDGERRTLYEINKDGIARIAIEGHITKGDSSFGGASSIRTRRALRMANDDPDVSAVLLHIDSPGGTAAGTHELAEEVRSVNADKPVYAHIDDMGASAAYYVASQARRITANQPGLVGSIGSMLMLVDSSGAAEKDGLKFHVLKTGEHKGTGAPGAPITDEQLAVEQRIVDELGQMFVDAVNRGRGGNIVLGEGAADGQVFIAETAKSLGLIDEVTTFDEAVKTITQEIPDMAETTTTMSVAEFEEANPDAVKDWKNEGFTEGHTEAAKEHTERAQALATAFKDRPAFAMEQILKGHDLPKARAELADVVMAEGKAKDKQIADLQAKLADTDGHDAVDLSVDAAITTGDADAPDDRPLAQQIDEDWEADKDGCKDKFKNKSIYRAFRLDAARAA